MFPTPTFVRMDFTPKPTTTKVKVVKLQEGTEISKVQLDVIGTEDVWLVFANGSIFHEVSIHYIYDKN